MMGSREMAGMLTWACVSTALWCKILNGERASGCNQQGLLSSQLRMYTRTETQRVKCAQHPQCRTRPCSPRPKLPERSCIARSDIVVEAMAYVVQWNEMQLVAPLGIVVRSV